MKAKLFLSLFFLAALTTDTLAQQRWCANPEVLNRKETAHPGYLQAYRQLFTEFRNSGGLPVSRSADTVYFIQVAVHVVYNTPEQNLPDSVIYNQIEVLNAAYARTNSDTINMRSVFNPVKGKDCGIRFVLATTDPSGNPTNGIIRTQTSETTFLDLLGGGLAEGVKSASSGGSDPWDQSRYLNIWVCNMAIPIVNIVTVLGYASPPDNLPNWPPGSTAGISDGVVIQYQCFGANNPNDLSILGNPVTVEGLTTVHEVGHYLGLRHIWGDDTNCTGDDGIDDTPAASDASATDCDPTKNTCVDNIAGTDLPDMIENYMDYSSEDCQNSFTAQQSDFVKWVLVNFRPNIATASLASLKPSAAYERDLIMNNPVQQTLHLKARPDDAGVFELFIYDETGRKCFASATDACTIDVSSLESGIYFVTLRNNIRFYSGKFVKQ